jgi:3-hydroxyacyl-CoA dehydrogenase
MLMLFRAGNCPCPLLVKKVAAGRLGRKTNHELYDYRKKEGKA